MGATLLLAAAVKLAASVRWRGGEWARTGWLLILIVFSLELLLYMEVSEHAAH